MQRIINSLRILSTCILFFVAFSLQAQDTPSRDFILSAEGHTGFLMAHHSNMSQLIRGHLFGGELNYVYRTDGSKPWHQIHKYPEIGICALHLDLANPEQLGTLEAIYPYTNIRLNKLERRFSLNLRLGLGLCYITLPFDRLTNHKDNAIGSHLNGFVNLRLNTEVKLSKSWRLNAGVGLSHASNGAMKTPNLGLNMTTVNLGIGYVFGNKDLQYKKDSVAKAKKEWHPSVIGVIGMKEMMPPGTQHYYAYGLMVNMYRTLNHKNKIGGGIEMSYNNSLKKVLREDSLSFSNSNMLRAGVKFCYSFNMHRISIPIDFGVYFYDQRNYDGRFFHRVGLRYMVTKHLIANVTLITHWAVADYFEWGLGYQL
jgi:hypothetical protein